MNQTVTKNIERLEVRSWITIQTTDKAGSDRDGAKLDMIVDKFDGQSAKTKNIKKFYTSKIRADR
jgi:hypothetical protein